MSYEVHDMVQQSFVGCKSLHSYALILEELMSGLYNQISSPSTARANSPNINMRSSFDVERYMNFVVKPFDFLEILRVSGKNGLMQNQGFGDYDRVQFGSPKPNLMPSLDIQPNFTGWNSMSHEGLVGVQGLNVDWQASGVPNSNIVKRILRLDIANDNYPNVRRSVEHFSAFSCNLMQFNIVGRLLGPRGNSLKRVEATTGCRVYIRGKGSIKELDKEELLRGRPGYEHLNEPLHILIEAELPVNIVDIRLRQAQEIIEELLKPMDESQDLYKRQQLRELAMLNSNFREESPQLSGSPSTFTSNEMKRAKTDQ
ncbi:hypothetical protein V8G54_037141 [Vigna mungo]|uniref:KHDC4/BBP-like KH-domain type I domain-containing protein n=1 Tax=Vigna mungo TaxID=3915 RepID=A0AAQ3MI96_VIGMU